VKINYLIFGLFIIGIAFVSGCAVDYEEDKEKQINPFDDVYLSFIPDWGECEDKDVKFSVSPMDPEVITEIEPMGKMHESHPTPTNHMYIRDDIGWDGTGRTTYDVVSPADGQIVSIEAMPSVNDYLIFIWHSCSLSSVFNHLADLPPEIRAITGELPSGSQWYASNKNPIFVKAGQSIGRSKGSFDFAVQNSEVILSGFIIPEHYNERGKINKVDPFDYFVEPIRSQLLKKNLRTVEPFGGKIDYDIDGKLVGNWFLEGTEDYIGSGLRFEGKPYSYGHLAIAYNHIDPTLVEVSFGAEDDIGITTEDCNVCSYSFGVKGNKPDPADVSVETGLVKYELLGEEHIDHPTLGVRVGVSTDEILGVFLVQMLDGRTIKGEVFAKKTASQVTGFTNNAKIYER